MGLDSPAAHERIALNSTKRGRCHISSATVSAVKNSTTWERKTSNVQSGVSALLLQLRNAVKSTQPGWRLVFVTAPHTFMSGLKTGPFSCPLAAPSTAFGWHSQKRTHQTHTPGHWHRQGHLWVQGFGSAKEPQNPQNNDSTLLIALVYIPKMMQKKQPPATPWNNPSFPLSFSSLSKK